MTLEQLSWFVDNNVAKELLSIPGMSQVGRSGGVDREIRVILDPARMQSYGLTASQVNQQLRSEEHTSELQSLMRISYAVFCLKKKTQPIATTHIVTHTPTSTSITASRLPNTTYHHIV